MKRPTVVQGPAHPISSLGARKYQQPMPGPGRSGMKTAVDSWETKGLESGVKNKVFLEKDREVVVLQHDGRYHTALALGHTSRTDRLRRLRTMCVYV